MNPPKSITGQCLVATLGLLIALPYPSLAMRAGAQQRHAAPPPAPAQRAPAPAQRAPAPQQHMARPQQLPPGARQQGHAGDWLRQYKDLPPAEQERALQNDPAFRRLPPGQQQVLKDRLQRFSNLPPQQQLRVLNRMETWEHLTPVQKQQARQLYSQ